MLDLEGIGAASGGHDEDTVGRLHRGAGKFLLQKVWLLMQKRLPRPGPAAVHISMDAASAGGHESEIAYVYLPESNTGFWAPPVDP